MRTCSKCINNIIVVTTNFNLMIQKYEFIDEAEWRYCHSETFCLPIYRELHPGTSARQHHADFHPTDLISPPEEEPEGRTPSKQTTTERSCQILGVIYFKMICSNTFSPPKIGRKLFTTSGCKYQKLKAKSLSPPPTPPSPLVYISLLLMNYFYLE